MKIEQKTWDANSLAKTIKGTLNQPADAQLVFLFGDSSHISQPNLIKSIKQNYPKAVLIGASTSGNIAGKEVLDECIVTTAVHFEKSTIKFVSEKIEDAGSSYTIGNQLMDGLKEKADLRHVFVLSEGLKVNGSDLARGLQANSPKNVSITGGLAGDGTAFKKTWLINDNMISAKRIAAIGFYGDIRVNYGCVHGWEDFGIERTITKSEGNVVYEIDNEPALQLYKKYLGDYAADLPSSGLLFPLSVRMSEKEEPLVRTLLAVDEEKQSLTFAGDVPTGKVAILMKTNIDGLIAAAEQAGAKAGMDTDGDALAIAVSCVGRRLVLKKMVEEETEAVQSKLGEKFFLTGYYSYGELAPAGELIECKLHNQTMTLTTFSE